MSPVVTTGFSIPYGVWPRFLQIEEQIGGIHDLYLEMEAHILRAGRIILSGTGVLIVLEVTHPTRELLVGLNEADHRGQKFSVGGGEGGIGPHQFFQHSLLSGRSRIEGIEIFFEVSSRPGRTICMIFLDFRRLPKCAVRGSKLVLDSKGLLLDLGLPVSCLVQPFIGRPILLVLGKVLSDLIRSGETLHWKHGVCCYEEEGVLRYGVARSLGAFLRILEHFDVLRYSLHIQMVVMHIVLQC